MYDVLSSISRIANSILVSHVLILDTGSTYAPMSNINPSKFENFLLLVFRENDNMGYARGNNMLLRKAISLSNNDDLIIVCNPDTPLDIKTVVSLMEIHSSSPLIFAVSPLPSSSFTQKLERPQDVFRKYSRIRFLSSKSTLLYVGDKPCIETVFLPGSYLMLKAALLNENTLFNEAFFMYLEEIELIYRMSRLGNKSLISLSDSFSHNVGQMLYHPRKIYYTTRNSVSLFKSLPLKSMPAFFIGRFLKPFFVLGFTFIVNHEFQNIWASFHGFYDGLRGKNNINLFYH